MTGLQMDVSRDQVKGVPEFSLSHWQEATETQLEGSLSTYGVVPYFKDDQTLPARNLDGVAYLG